MNQTEQMREALQDALIEFSKATGAQVVQMVIDGKGTLGEQVIIFSISQLQELIYQTQRDVVEKTLATEPTKLVRLTEEEVIAAWDGHIIPVFGKTGINVIVFAHAIMDAMIAKNGGK